MFKKDWNKIIKKSFSSKGRDTYKLEITPYRDWRFLVSAFFVALVVSFGFNIYMSVKINSDSFFPSTTGTRSTPELNKEGLARVIAEFEEKETRFEKAKTEGVSIVDPSL